MTSTTVATSPTVTTAATASTTADEVTVRGPVSDFSASARVITLAPVNGVVNLALTADTEIVHLGGAPATISDVHAGAIVEATGRRSTPDTLVVRRLVLL